MPRGSRSADIFAGDAGSRSLVVLDAIFTRPAFVGTSGAEHKKSAERSGSGLRSGLVGGNVRTAIADSERRRKKQVQPFHRLAL